MNHGVWAASESWKGQENGFFFFLEHPEDLQNLKWNFFSYCCKPLSLREFVRAFTGSTCSHLPGGPRICAFPRFPHWLFFQISQNLPWKMLQPQDSEEAPLWISKLPCLVDQSLYLSLETKNFLSSSPRTLSDWRAFSLQVYPSMLPTNRTARAEAVIEIFHKRILTIRAPLWHSSTTPNHPLHAEAEAPILWSPDANSQLIGKHPIFWERLKAGGEGEGSRGWDGWMASLTQWIWLWANARRWWRTREPGVLQSMRLQRVG